MSLDKFFQTRQIETYTLRYIIVFGSVAAGYVCGIVLKFSKK